MSNVFISHRGSDTPQAEALALELRAHGHEVWLDQWNIQIGDSIVEKMNEGLDGSTLLVLCYSAAGVMSPWMSREWMSALARQLASENVRLLPARLTGGDPPAILRDLKYADLVRDWDGGVRALLAAIAQ